jgi:hypothetical protein
MGCEFELLFDAREGEFQVLSKILNAKGEIISQETLVTGPVHRNIDGKVRKNIGTYMMSKKITVDLQGNAVANFTKDLIFNRRSGLPHNDPLSSTQMMYNRKNGKQTFSWPAENPTELIPAGRKFVKLCSNVNQNGGLTWTNQNGCANKIKDETPIRRVIYYFSDRATVMDCIARDGLLARPRVPPIINKKK